MNRIQTFEAQKARRLLWLIEIRETMLIQEILQLLTLLDTPLSHLRFDLWFLKDARVAQTSAHIG